VAQSGLIIWRSLVGLFGVVGLGAKGEAVGGDLDRRMSVLGPHVFDGAPLMRSAAAAGVPLRDRAAVVGGVHRRGSGWPGPGVAVGPGEAPPDAR
jgi:hypothetical protein